MFTKTLIYTIVKSMDYMSRRRGEHDERRKTKKDIVKYILSEQEGAVEEPILREYLGKESDKKEGKGIKIHLDDLLKSGCLRRERAWRQTNVWIIDSIKHIQKIVEFFDDDIVSMINESDVAINLIRDSILGEERIKNLDLPLDQSNLKFYNETIHRWFKLSPSFFEFCLYNDHETIMNRWKEVSLLDSGFGLVKKRPMINSDGKLTFRRDETTDAKFFEELFFEFMESIFERFVLNDVLNGRSNSDAKKYIENKRKAEIENNKKSRRINKENNDRIVLRSLYIQTFFETEREIYRTIILDEWEPYQKLIQQKKSRGVIMTWSAPLKVDR